MRVFDLETVGIMVGDTRCVAYTNSTDVILLPSANYHTVI